MKEAKFAFQQSIPILFAYVFLGIAFGTMMAGIGYSVIWSLASAVFIFAGSLQIVMVSFLKAGLPLWSVAVMAFFINARHLFYGISLIERFRGAGWRRPYQIFALTDETYSILCSIQYPPGLDRHQIDFLIAAFNQSYWVIGCVLGTLAGHLLPVDLSGIEFSATAFFVVVTVDQWRSYSSKVPALTGLAAGIVFYLVLGPDRFLIPALAVSTAVLVLLKDIVGPRMDHSRKALN